MLPWVALAVSLLASCGHDEPGPAPNVLLVVLDTVRADHLGFHGHSRPTTPTLDALAAEAVVFESAVSQAPWTAASVASLFTGLYPSVHGLDSGPEMVRPQRPGDLPFRGQKILADRHDTLAERLRRAGYATAAFVSNVFVHSVFGFAQGFDVYDDDHADYSAEFVLAKRRGRVTNERIFRWLENGPPEPFLLVAHYNDAHWPYDPPAHFGREFTEGYTGAIRPERTGFLVERAGRPLDGLDEADLRYVVGLYDGELQYLDDVVGALLAKVRAVGLTRRVVTVVTADHGEEFLDHGATSHGYTLYEEQLHVPLVIHDPARRAPRRVSTPVELIDVLPTLLEIAGVGADGVPVQGRSLAALLAGREEGDGRPVFAGATLRGGVLGRLESVRSGPLKLIVPEASAPRAGWLFDLATDPGERRNLFADVRLRAPLGEAIEAWRTANARTRERLSGPAGAAVPIDRETLERLRALGYARE